jgi:dinuclear metal center YbgI/SA1388 family protein
MAKVRDVLSALEAIAPRRFAASWDKIGLQVGDPDAEVTRAVVSLDRSLAAVETCIQEGAQLLLSHHPLIFAPVQTVDTRRHDTRTILKLAQNGIHFVTAHTNWDAAHGGVNDALATLLGLRDVKPFGMGSEVKSSKLVFFVPAASADATIDAVSKAGAGVIGAYTRCAFLTDGRGTFFGGEGTTPTVGEAGRQETVEEVRVEMTVPGGREASVTRALVGAHPYEEPAFDILPLQGTVEQPTGRVGRLEAPLSLRDALAFVDSRLGTQSLAWGDPAKRIRKVAVFGGSADSEWMNAQRLDADLLVTGEVKQHIALEASESGMCLFSSGHYATEQPGVVALRECLAEAVPEIEWSVFAPEPGQAGRPFFG